MMGQSELLEIIIAQLGLRDLSTEKQGEVIRRLQANVASRVNVAIIEALPETDHPELLRLSEVGTETDLDQFLKQHIPNLDDLIKNIGVEVVEEFKTLAR